MGVGRGGRVGQAEARGAPALGQGRARLGARGLALAEAHEEAAAAAEVLGEVHEGLVGEDGVAGRAVRGRDEVGRELGRRGDGGHVEKGRALGQLLGVALAEVRLPAGHVVAAGRKGDLVKRVECAKWG